MLDPFDKTQREEIKKFTKGGNLKETYLYQLLSKLENLGDQAESVRIMLFEGFTPDKTSRDDDYGQILYELDDINRTLRTIPGEITLKHLK